MMMPPPRALLLAARPHLLAVGLFWLAVMGYFYPVFLQDKHLIQPDDEQDLMMNERVMQEAAQQQTPIFWNPSIFSGMPTYVALAWESPIVACLHSLFTLHIKPPMGALFTALLCMYLMLLCFSVRPALAVFGAFAFAFSSYHAICFLAGHSERLSTLAYMPLLLGGVHLAFRRQKIALGSLLLVVGLSLQLRANHLQIVYYTLLLLLSYTLFCVIVPLKRRNYPHFFKAGGAMVLAGLLGIATAWGSLSSMYEYARHSIRGEHLLAHPTENETTGLGREYAFAYSFRILEPLTLLIPNFQGGTHAETLPAGSAVDRHLAARGIPPDKRREICTALPTYWGDQPISFPNYAGVTVLALFALGLVWAERRLSVWALVITAFACMLAWGRNFAWLNELLFDHMPFYNRFRSQGFVLCLPILCFPLVATLGLERLLGTSGWRRTFAYPFGGVLLVLAVVFLGSFFFSYQGAADALLTRAGYPRWFLFALQEDRRSLLWWDLLRSLVFLLGLFGVFYLGIRHQWSRLVLVLVLGLAVMADLLSVNARLLSHETAFSTKPLKERYPATPADHYILSHNEEEARVLYMPNPFNDNRACYRHASAGGYHAAKLRRYDDLMRFGMSPQMAQLREERKERSVNFSDLYVLNMLNVGYFIFGEEAEDVLHNPMAYGPAWLAKRIRAVQSPMEEITALRGLPNEYAVVDTTQYALNQLAFPATGAVSLLSHTANRIRYRATLEGAALAVFSEVYYPDWKAHVNGEEQPIYRANYLLRALVLPEGDHDIVFTITPNHYAQKRGITRAANYLLLLLLLLSAGWGLWGGSSKPPAQAKDAL